jgi:phospholipid transport system substrate-binding protein
MNKGSVAAILLGAVMLLIPFQVLAASPKETVETEVNNVVKTLGDPQFKTESREVKIAKIREIVNQVFDYTELSKRTLGRNWKNLTAEQQHEFVELFSELLEKVYADRLLAYSDEKVIFEKETMLKENQAEVQSFVLTSDGKNIPIFYRMLQNGNQWRIYDVIIEGVSLVKNYRTQFKEILDTGSPEKVLEVLREKVKQNQTAS